MSGRTDRVTCCASASRIVVKLGTRMVTRSDRALDRRALGRIAEDVAALSEQGRQFTIVSSGAIGAGIGRLGLRSRPRDVPRLQAAASVGQAKLMEAYDRIFSRLGRHIGQVLLTAEDLSNPQRRRNVQRTMETLWDWGIIPIVNENDTVATEEITYGDNDTLSAHLAGLISAQLLVILTDVDGLLTVEGDVLPEVRGVTAEVAALAQDGWHLGVGGAHFSVGGMQSKLAAAGLATRAGKAVLLANGKTHRLADLLAGASLGTFFAPVSGLIASRRLWLAHAARSRGTIVIDDGAVRALTERRTSLLPSGIAAVVGSFDSRDPVEIADERGRPVAMGLSRYAAEELARIKGRRSSEIVSLLGYARGNAVVHRDDLVLVDVPVNDNAVELATTGAVAGEEGGR